MSALSQPAGAESHRLAEAQAPIRVLLVEDEAVVALNLEALVEDLGCEVVGIATTHVQALDLARRRLPQVAVVDVNLRDGRSGLRIAEDLAKAFGTIVVLATGNPDGIEAGGFIFAVVRKPYTNDVLERVIRRAAEPWCDAQRASEPALELSPAREQVNGGA